MDAKSPPFGSSEVLTPELFLKFPQGQRDFWHRRLIGTAEYFFVAYCKEPTPENAQILKGAREALMVAAVAVGILAYEEHEKAEDREKLRKGVE
jgi:hypothetical protein